MINHNAYLRILRQEIEDYYKQLKEISGDMEWEQPHINKLKETIDAVLKRRIPKEMQTQIKPSISISVLKSIFKYNTYTITEPIDQRQRKILDKLAIFRGHEHWDDFIKEKNTLKGKRYTQNPDIILDVVRKATEAEFKAYKALPTIRRATLEKYIVKDSPAYNLNNDILIKHKERGWILTNEHNPSLIEIYDIPIKTVKAKEAVVLSNQHWWLRWWSVPEKKYRWFYNHKGEQEFKLICTAGTWKVYSNFYSATRDGGTFGKEWPYTFIVGNSCFLIGITYTITAYKFHIQRRQKPFFA